MRSFCAAEKMKTRRCFQGTDSSLELSPGQSVGPSATKHWIRSKTFGQLGDSDNSDFAGLWFSGDTDRNILLEYPKRFLRIYNVYSNYLGGVGHGKVINVASYRSIGQMMVIV